MTSSLNQFALFGKIFDANSYLAPNSILRRLVEPRQRFAKWNTSDDLGNDILHEPSVISGRAPERRARSGESAREISDGHAAGLDRDDDGAGAAISGHHGCCWKTAGMQGALPPS